MSGKNCYMLSQFYEIIKFSFITKLNWDILSVQTILTLWWYNTFKGNLTVQAGAF